MTIILELKIPDRKLSPNHFVGSRGGRMGKAAAIKKYRTAAKIAFWGAFNTAYRPKYKKASVQIEWIAKTHMHPDGDNALATMKAGIDGLCDAGLFADDRNLTYPPVVFRKDPANPRIRLLVTV